MTYYPDLTPYRYGFGPAAWGSDGPPSADPTDLYVWMWDASEGAFDVPELAVGWLEPPHAFPRGALDGALVEELERLCRASRYHLTRGLHPCGFCGRVDGGLGAQEIRLEGDGVVYAAPAMVAHYVRAHGWLPPDGFVAALARRGELAQPRQGRRAHVTLDMIPREPVPVAALEAALRADLQRNLRGEIFRDLSLRDGGDVVRVSAHLEGVDAPRGRTRTWDVTSRALLNMTQAVHGIGSMLEATYSELVLASLEGDRRRVAGRRDEP